MEQFPETLETAFVRGDLIHVELADETGGWWGYVGRVRAVFPRQIELELPPKSQMPPWLVGSGAFFSQVSLAGKMERERAIVGVGAGSPPALVIRYRSAS